MTSKNINLRYCVLIHKINYIFLIFSVYIWDEITDTPIG